MNRSNSSSQFRDSIRFATTNPASSKMGMSPKTTAPLQNRNKPKSNMKSYGQSGYRPSSGIGVGF